MKKLYLAITFIFCYSFIFSQAPSITTQPFSLVKCLGSVTSLSITATGAAPLSYQWKKSGINVGANSSTLDFPSLQPTDDGDYVCEVTNGTGTATSNTALVRVVPSAPSITSQPTGQMICEGENAVMNVTVTGLYLGFQWMHNSVNIPNAFANIYAINPAVSTDNGSYNCSITNACGSVTSNIVTLTVNMPPQIIVEPTNQVVCLGSNAVFSVTATGSGLSFKWKKDGATIVGANNNILTIPNISITDEASYLCTIWNNCDTVTSNLVVLTTNTLPSITAQPYNYSECTGDTFKFITTSVGTPPITYQWYHQGIIVTDSTNHTLTINNTTSTDSGSYYCGITNICGTVNTDIVSLIVKLPPAIVTQPDGRIRCNGDTVSFSVKVVGEEPFSYQWLWQGANISGANSSILSLSSINEGDAGPYSCIITNICGEISTDTALLVVNTPPLIILQPSSSTVCEATFTVLTVQVQGSELITYSWTHNGSILPGSGHDHYTINPITPASAGTYQCFATNVCGADTSSLITINVNTLPNVTLQPENQATCINGSVTFSTTATGTDPLTYQWMKDNVQIGGETNTTYSLSNIQPFDAGNYTCQIYNLCGDIVTEVAALAVNDAPTMNTTLYNRTRCAGDSVSFHVSADGGTLLYQWIHDGSLVAGETTNVLLYNDPTVSESGLYYCIVQNNCGIDSTNTFSLTINPAAVVDLGSDVALCNGDSVILSSGSFQLYHWNGTMASTPSIQVDTSGIFILEAWNQYSCKGSDTVVVTVNPVLHVSLGRDTVVCGSYTLNAGAGASSYIWNNGLESTQIVTITVSGLYSVVVTAPGGCSSVDSVDVQIKNAPVFSLGNDTSIEYNDTLILTGPTGTGYTYYWAGSGSNSQSYTIYGIETSQGMHSYSLKVTNEWNCSTTHAINVTINVNDISELNSDELINLFPNPTNGNISLKFSNDNYKKYQLEIINVLGQKLLTTTIESGVTGISPSVNLSGLPKGNYYLRLSSSDKNIIKKITIQ